MNKLTLLLRSLGFHSRWQVLDAMIPGKWYFGLDLVKENHFSMGAIYVQLGRLEDEGFVESRPYHEGRRQYRKTGKKSTRHWFGRHHAHSA